MGGRCACARGRACVGRDGRCPDIGPAPSPCAFCVFKKIYVMFERLLCNSDIYAVYRFPEMIFLVANDVLARHIFNEVERRSEYWFENIKHFLWLRRRARRGALSNIGRCERAWRPVSFVLRESGFSGRKLHSFWFV